MFLSLVIDYILNLSLLLMHAFGNREEWKKRDRSTYPQIKPEKIAQNLFPSVLFGALTSYLPVTVSDYYIKQLSSSSKMVLLY